MKVLGEKDCQINVMKGDTVSLKYGEIEVLTAEIDKEMSLNHAVVFRLEPGECGFKDGIGGMFVEK